MDRINIKKLEIFAKHGVLPVEKQYRQQFLVSAALHLDLRGAGKSDDLKQTIDYGKICLDIKDFVGNHSFDLIETVAEKLAEKLLIENPALQKVWIEVSKPEARIAANFETVSAEIERCRHTAFIALGSNMGDKEANIRSALDELRKERSCRVVSQSGLINTAPYGLTEQDDFLNGCAMIDTLLTPHELLKLLQEIENRAGRERVVKWGPRTLDLDIVFYDDAIVSDNLLRIPHPEMHKRDFVLLPLSEIAPDKLHPILKKTVSELIGTY